MVKKVLFFDIDGTLLNSELKIPEGVKKELKRLKDAGHYLFVASGRPLAFISNQIIEAGFDGFVLCNGAHVELNHKIIFENRIPYEKVVGLMKMLESVDCEYNYETATDCYIDPAYHNFIEFFKICDIRHEKLITNFDKEEVMHRSLKIEISAKKDHDKIIDYIADKFYFDHHGTANSFEICALDTSKATGVEKVLEHLNIDKDHSYAFGDGLNDLEMIKYQKERHVNALDKYIELFGEENVDIYSAPGRTEVGGNHTDHQHGMVLAASVNLDAIAIVGNNDKNTIELFSEGYSPLSISLDNIAVNEAEFGTTSALIKGVIAGMNDHGYKTGPFKAYVTSDVLNGAGLSSSAAFEAIIGTILSGLYNDMKVSPIDIAIIGQYAENVFFGKPCGLMDQMACSVGGFVHIDFKDPANPIVEKVDFDIADKGYSLCIVDTKGSHADLTDDYSAIPKEMKEVAALFGKEFLNDIPAEEFFSKLPEIFRKVGDRNILRAMHFFKDNERVQKEVDALKADDFDTFLSLIKESGDSSYKRLQNIYSNHDFQNQPVSIGIAISENVLGNNGVCRVHGGGFAGTIQAFVKTDFVPEYKKATESIFGEGACHVLKIRKYGGVKVL